MLAYSLGALITPLSLLCKALLGWSLAVGNEAMTFLLLFGGACLAHHGGPFLSVACFPQGKATLEGSLTYSKKKEKALVEAVKHLHVVWGGGRGRQKETRRERCLVASQLSCSNAETFEFWEGRLLVI